MTKNKIDPKAIIAGQAEYIQALERRCTYSERLVDRTIKLERDLGLARAAIADLKHQLFLIGSEESIQQAIDAHGGYNMLPTRQPSGKGKRGITTRWKSK